MLPKTYPCAFLPYVLSIPITPMPRITVKMSLAVMPWFISVTGPEVPVSLNSIGGVFFVVSVFPIIITVIVVSVIISVYDPYIVSVIRVYPDNRGAGIISKGKGITTTSV
jgi:hypothetical protein